MTEDEKKAALLKACETFIMGWSHFCKCINWNETALDAEAIKWMNETPNLIQKALYYNF